MSDKFTAAVKRELAARAGYQCSVCHKPTSGPAADMEATLSDGIAAHITAAAPGGARYDPSLSTEERRSADNGIWTCTQHGREVDDDRSAFSFELLRGLKRIREEAAARDVHPNSGLPDQSAQLIELPHVATAFKLFEVILPQQYTYPTTDALRKLVKQVEQPGPLMDLAAEVIPEIWETHANVAGILSTLLSTAVELWQPESLVLSKLESLCSRAIQTGDWSRVASVEPLAFALGAKGRHNIHRRVLERLIEERHWRDADAARIGEYYGSVGVELWAIARHWNDPFRNGLLRAHDVSRLIDLLLSRDRSLPTHSTEKTVIDLLDQHALVLLECGETRLARRVNELVTSLRHIGRKVGC